jgi:DNA-binding Xre family transcriptional regulator
MRLRIPELLERRGLTPYALASQSDGRISMSTAYRINRQRGRLKCFDADLVEALCDILRVEPSDLFERAPGKKGKRG